VDNPENRTIAVHIVGGLGNQMFQYACGRATALRSGARLLLDLSSFERYKLHRYGLDGFCIGAAAAPRRLQTGSALQASLGRFGLDKRRVMALQGFDYIAENANLDFEPRMLAPLTRAYVDGYWQNEVYFTDAASQIRAEFQLLRPSPVAQASDDLPQVSLHIRRGDYVNNPAANSVHGVLGLDYYRDAVALVASRIGDNFRLVVFSDDIEWARQNLTFSQPMTFVSGSTATPHEDLHMMASCDHHIIANSSFSWWGAWLNASTTKIVIAPKRWFVAPQFSQLHICPPEWERV
jgi:hypothetical protein